MTDDEFYDKFGGVLNQQQKAAVFNSENRVLLLAVPGSGKTTVLVTHLGYMVCCKKVNPTNILTMTFTTAAAAEMKERFAKLFGGQCSRRITFCTINGLCNRIIQYVGVKSCRVPFTLIIETEAKSILRKIYQKINHEYAAEGILNDLCSHISYIKNMHLGENEIHENEFTVPHIVEIYREYNLTLRKLRKMDFDDQLVYAYQLLCKFPQIREFYQNKFSYICVDEAQDTSRIQHLIIHLLIGKTGRLFMVGDEDQSIYGFRGAYPAALLQFENDYPKAKIITMEYNYRSSKSIIDSANGFIRKNIYRRDKTIKATQGDGKSVQVIQVPSRDEQYTYLFEVLKKCKEETAVLYRNNDSVLPLLDLLDRNGISYRCPKKEISFFSHRIIADIRSIFQFSVDPCNSDIFMDIYYKVGLHLTKEMAGLACQESNRTGKGILEALLMESEIPGYVKDNVVQLQEVLTHVSHRNAYDVLCEIWTALSYQDFVKERQMDSGKFSILQTLSRQTDNCFDLCARLVQLENLMRNGLDDEESPVILSTIHSSKGMEYKHVYLLDVIDGQLPMVTEGQAKDILQYEEERRICYVGMTRAKASLHVFRCKGCPSVFISELDDIIHGRTPKKSVKKIENKKSELRMKHPKPIPRVIAVTGNKITHVALGHGVIQSVNGDIVSIWMKDQNKQMTFSWHTLLEKHLLDFNH